MLLSRPDPVASIFVRHHAELAVLARVVPHAGAVVRGQMRLEAGLVRDAVHRALPRAADVAVRALALEVVDDMAVEGGGRLDIFGDGALKEETTNKERGREGKVRRWEQNTTRQMGVISSTLLLSRSLISCLLTLHSGQVLFLFPYGKIIVSRHVVRHDEQTRCPHLISTASRTTNLHVLHLILSRFTMPSAAAPVSAPSR